MKSTASGRVVAPWPLTAFLLVAVSRLTLRFLGFAKAIAITRRIAGRRSEITGAALVVPEVCRRVALAGVFFPGRARCLEQSLALYVLLRRRGVPAQLRIGVQPYPFNAHAWVELSGAPLNEQPEMVRQFVPLQDFAV
jgi:transglutaminase-like putative cysteine protease